MNYIDNVNLKVENEENVYNMVVEIPKGTKSKFELVEPEFDRVESVRELKLKYPFYYGCFPQTLARDGDALDCILFTKEKHESLDVCQVIPVGVIYTVDGGFADDKILCIEKGHELFSLKKEVANAVKFLKEYKGKNSNTVVAKNIGIDTEAIGEITFTHEFYNNSTVDSNRISIL